MRDAGCEPALIRCFLQCRERGETKYLLQLLDRHRRELLDVLHREQRRIDCLDYLVYQIKKEGCPPR